MMQQIKERRRVLGPALDGPTIWLSYLLLYVWPWVIEPPRPLEWQASLVAAPVFLVAYYLSFDLRGRAAWPGIAVIMLLSLGLGHLTAAASIVSLFAVMIAVQSQRGKVRRYWLIGMTAVTALCVAAGWVSWIFALGAVFFGALMAAATAANCQLQDQAEQLIRAQAQAEALAVMSERERISRDLHDVVGQSFSTIVLKSDLASRVFEDAPERARKELEDINAVGRSALHEIRSVIRGLNHSTLLAATAQVRTLLDAADIELSFANSAENLPDSIEHALAMVMREAVTNVVRHAEASTCTIAIHEGNGLIHMEISDNGRGGPIVFGHGLGGIKRRVAELGGAFEISAQTPAGVKISVNFQMNRGGRS